MACVLCGRTERGWYKCDRCRVVYRLCDQHMRAHVGANKPAVCRLRVPTPGHDLKSAGKTMPLNYRLAPLTYYTNMMDLRRELRANTKAPGAGTGAAMQLVNDCMTTNFVITHETTWEGLAFILARGGVDSQSSVLKHAPNAIATHYDSVMGGGNYVYTRVVTPVGPAKPLNEGSAGASSPILLAFNRNLVRDRWMQMFGSHTDLYGKVGVGEQQARHLSGYERGELALSTLLSQLRTVGGPSENNEFGFLGRIDFVHLRAIVVKTQNLHDPTIATRPNSQLANQIQQAIGVRLSTQAHRINPKRARNGSMAYTVANDDTTTSAQAFTAAFQGNLGSKFFALPKATLRSNLLTELAKHGF